MAILRSKVLDLCLESKPPFCSTALPIPSEAPCMKEPSPLTLDPTTKPTTASKVPRWRALTRPNPLITLAHFLLPNGNTISPPPPPSNIPQPLPHSESPSLPLCLASPISQKQHAWRHFLICSEFHPLGQVNAFSV
ncbi:hypothetical protein VNO77_06707 [Canavalia gladiata]|uniref:Uncharacterized protein n=1 Tax=Canavalia gladiata TaxID=3824 RepID=A0AAN9QVE8_CANGL